MKKNYLGALPLSIIVLLVVTMIACNGDATTSSETTQQEATPAPALVFDKLVGTWQQEDGRSYEAWTKNSSGTYRAVAYSVKGKDTSWNEQVDIYPENNQWVYENTVKNQNDGKAVRFISLSVNETSVLFSNPAHDFPTEIGYHVPGNNTVNAFIVGPNGKGGKDTIPFNYTRVK